MDNYISEISCKMNIANTKLKSLFSLSAGLSVGAAVGIAVVLTFLVAFSAGLSVAFAIAYCYIRRQKGQYSPGDSQPPAPQQPAPMYEELVTHVQPGSMEMKANVAYGPISH